MIDPAYSLLSHLELRKAEDGIAQIFIDGDVHAGMAVFVGGSELITCAHVVNKALRRNKLDAKCPEASEQVEFVFYYFDGDGNFKSSDKFKAWVTKWGLAEEPGVDLAVLTVIGKPPSDLRHAVFTNQFKSGDEWTVCGQHDGDDKPHWTTEKGTSISKATGSNYTELQGGSGAGRWIDHGDSGGGVWCKDRFALVGIATTKHRESATTRIAEMLATDVIKGFWRNIDCDDPDNPPSDNVPIGIMASILAVFVLFGLFAPWPTLTSSSDKPIFQQLVKSSDRNPSFEASDVKYVGRNLVELRLRRPTAEQLAMLASFKHLRTLEVHDCASRDITVLSNLNALTQIRLESCAVDDASLSSLAGLKNLEQLYLTNCRALTEKGLSHLADLPNLKFVFAKGTAVTGKPGNFKGIKLVY